MMGRESTAAVLHQVLVNQSLISMQIIPPACANKSDIFFVVSLHNGTSELCSISTIKTTIQDSPPESPYGKNFSFTFDDFQMW